MKEVLKLFDQAYDKAARNQAGQDPHLSEAEEQVPPCRARLAI